MSDPLALCPEPEEWLPLAAAGARHALRGGETRTRQWALVLDSRFIPCRLEHDHSGWQLLVPADRLADAVRELTLYEEENRDWPPLPPPPHPLAENTLATLSVLLLLATFYNITRLDFIAADGTAINWLELGAARAGTIRDGEWWRLITALTLHADLQHLLANVTIGGIFIFLLCRELGSGVAWSLLLAAGLLGNLANALLQSRLHSSIGASTAVFGAVGILAALSLVRHRHYLRRRLLLPLAAAVALLAILGTEGKNTDLGAHLFGFLSGVLLGGATEGLIARRGHPGRSLNVLLALVSGVVVCGAWWLALEYGGR